MSVDARVACIFRAISESLESRTRAQLSSTMAVTAPNSTLDDDPPPLSQPTDLGFGSVVAQAVRGRFLNRDGKPEQQEVRARRAARSRASISPRSMRAGLRSSCG